jgi:hypothetical protein
MRGAPLMKLVVASAICISPSTSRKRRTKGGAGAVDDQVADAAQRFLDVLDPAAVGDGEELELRRRRGRVILPAMR